MGSTSFPINYGSVSTMSITQESVLYAKDNKANIYATITMTSILLESEYRTYNLTIKFRVFMTLLIRPIQNLRYGYNVRLFKIKCDALISSCFKEG